MVSILKVSGCSLACNGADFRNLMCGSVMSVRHNLYPLWYQLDPELCYNVVNVEKHIKWLSDPWS